MAEDLTCGLDGSTQGEVIGRINSHDAKISEQDLAIALNTVKVTGADRVPQQEFDDFKASIVPQLATAWVNFDATTPIPTIRDSFNVSEVIKISTGIFEIVFSAPMDNTNYSVSGLTSRGTSIPDTAIMSFESTLSTKIDRLLINTTLPSNGAFNDSSLNSVQIFGGKNL